MPDFIHVFLLHINKTSKQNPLKHCANYAEIVNITEGRSCKWQGMLVLVESICQSKDGLTGKG